MKKVITALLATGLMSVALAQTAPPADSSSQTPTPTATPAVAGAKTATVQSLGDMTPFYVIGGVAVVGIVVAASSGNNDHASGSPSTPPPTGTTGTH